MARSIMVRADSAVAPTRPWRARICSFLAAAARSRRTLAENASTVAGWSPGGPYLHRTQAHNTLGRLRYRPMSEPCARCKSAARIGYGRRDRRWDLHFLQAHRAPAAREPSGAPDAAGPRRRASASGPDAGDPWRGQPRHAQESRHSGDTPPSNLSRCRAAKFGHSAVAVNSRSRSRSASSGVPGR